MSTYKIVNGIRLMRNDGIERTSQANENRTQIDVEDQDGNCSA